MARFVVAGASVLSACGGVDADADLATTEGGIIGGQPHMGDPSVVALVAESSTSFGYCTAEIVAPTVVLTAAHCVIAAQPDVKYGILNLPNFAQGTTLIEVKEVHADPLFDPANPQNGHDIGVAILASPTDLPPLPFNRSTMAVADVGKAIRLVGYGIANGVNGTGGRVKRQVTTTLTEVAGPLLAIGQTGQQGCSGDSGGPAFMLINGVETIVGLTSFGNQDCTRGGFYTRVDTYAPFVEQYIASEASRLPPPAPPPEPAPKPEDPPEPPDTPGTPPPSPGVPPPDGGAPPNERAGETTFSGDLQGGCTCAPRGSWGRVRSALPGAPPASQAANGGAPSGRSSAALFLFAGLFFARQRRKVAPSR